MEYLEFRRLLASDPDNRDPEFQRLKREDPRCAAAAAQASRFEHGLRRALSVPVPEGLVDRIILRQTTPVASRRRRMRWAWAMAATIAVGIAVGVAYRLSTSPTDLESQIVSHVAHEKASLQKTERADPAMVQARFAEFDQALIADLGVITYAMRCPMPTGDGVHLVVQQDSGPVTVFFMPAHEMRARIAIRGLGMEGVVMPFKVGSLALLGGTEGERQALALRLRDGVVPLSVAQPLASLNRAMAAVR